jgi:hypothetical protein
LFCQDSNATHSCHNKQMGRRLCLFSCKKPPGRLPLFVRTFSSPDWQILARTGRIRENECYRGWATRRLPPQFDRHIFGAGKCQPLNITTSADDALVNLTSRPVIFNGTSYSQLIGATLERELRLCIVKHHRIQLSVLARRDERFFHRGCRLIVSW